MGQLPLLEPHRREHTYCTYCPKLCRFSCPVSVAHASETTTPWAKMTSAHHVDDANLELTPDVAESWYGCTGCLRCRSHCAHENEVAATLHAARAEAVQHGVAPAAATDVVAAHSKRAQAAAQAGANLFGKPETERRTAVTYFPGCTANVLCPDDAMAGHQAVRALSDAAVRVEAGPCCGLPLLDAGDINGFRRAASAALSAIDRAATTVFLDPGCLHALKVEAPRHGLKPPTDRMVHLSEFAAQNIDRIRPAQTPTQARYHDPCRLGRGLGVYEAPRKVLSKLLGAPPEEFHHRRTDSICAGGGGQLPRTDPSAASAIAKDRLAQHEWVGGGPIVTACPASARQFARAGDAEILSFARLLAAQCEDPT